MQSTSRSRQCYSVRYLSSALIVLVFVMLMAGGCVVPGRTSHHQSSSVLQFIYPDDAQPLVKPRVPTLRLPLRVGIAFAPSRGGRRSGADNFSEARKTELMRTVAEKFKSLPFVQSIELVPTTYLRQEGGFANVDQLQSMMGIDVIALISYDQAQSTADNEWSFAYWMIIGAYVVPARRNETHTLMEAVVDDISSRSLLFRAPGVSAVKGPSDSGRQSK
ncbi:MAG: rhombotarget lipoprotein [Candidatus Synoicihabitans palmerolidicus]|nr:rhombotarget lipoprotein [Candidatus Synoicihabitans palmerolidicus]